MAHFAQLDENNVVINVVVVDDTQEHRGNDFLSKDLGLGGNWIKTSYNTYKNIHKLGGEPFRKNYAGIGYTYDVTRDAFIPPKQYSSWVLNENTCQWEPPIEIPNDGNIYIWNEESQEWVEIV